MDNPPNVSVLLVEDDRPLGEATQMILKQYGYKILWVTDGAMALDAIADKKFDVIILDLGLPRVSGLDVLTTLRSNNMDVPVILLTALGTLQDRIRGLDAGADDYLIKPFDVDELIARIRALLRRTSEREKKTISYKGIVIDLDRHSVTINGEDVAFSRREFALLEKLLTNQGRVLSRDQMSQSLYGWDDDIDSNALEVHVHNIRKKVSGDIIRTIRGVGYMIEKAKPD